MIQNKLANGPITTEGESSALVFGCGTGHSSFLLSRMYGKVCVGRTLITAHLIEDHTCYTYVNMYIHTRTLKVIGIDYCGRFIDTARQLQKGKELEYGADLQRRAKIPSDTQMSRVEFKQVCLGVAATALCQFLCPSHFLLPLPSQLTWVPNETQAADLVLLEFLERVDSPKAWLCKLWECVKPGGVLGVITSSTQWTSTNIQGIIGKW